jgi:hypothetical protein
MTRFFLTVAFGAGCFLLGYWLASHPEDARSFGTKLRARVSELIRKKPPETGA